MTTSYAQAEERLERFFQRDHAAIGDLGRSILLTHGSRTKHAVVLLHGMTASPAQFVELANALHQHGYNVLVPRLPKHGYSDRLTEALSRLSASELKDMTNEAIEIAFGLGESVTVVGFSLGGLLAAWAAQYHRLGKVVCIAPFFGVAWMPYRLGRATASIMLALPNRFHWWNPLKREKQMPAHGYPRYSTHAVAQAYRLVHDVFTDAQAHAPRATKIIVVTNSSETTISNRSARKLVQQWRAQAPDAIETFEFTGLPLSHDIIEPLRRPDIVVQVYPKLLELIEG